MLIIVFPTLAVVDTHTPPKQPPKELHGIPKRPPTKQSVMLPTIDVSVPMPRIKNDPRFVGSSDLDITDAAIVQKYLENKLSTRLAEIKTSVKRKIGLVCGVAGVLEILCLLGVWLKVLPSITLGLSTPSLGLGISFLVHKIQQQAWQEEKQARRERAEETSELGLCPPLP